MKINSVISKPNYYHHNKTNNNSNSNKNFVVKDKQTYNTSVWKELSQKYDITNTSFNELCEISRKLYDAKQISLSDHGSLTVVNQIIARMQARFNNEVNPFLTVNNKLTESTWKNTKINWIEEYEAIMRRNRKNGNITGYNHNKEILDFLNKLNT